MRIHLLFTTSIVTLLIGCTPEVPEQWTKIGIPQKGISKIYKRSDQNGFYAEYKTYSPQNLMDIVSSNLKEKGFAEVCNKTDLGIKGFEKGDRKYVVKIDGGTEMAGLSIANENGDESIFFGLCFKGYELGEPIEIK